MKLDANREPAQEEVRVEKKRVESHTSCAWFRPWRMTKEDAKDDHPQGPYIIWSRLIGPSAVKLAETL